MKTKKWLMIIALGLIGVFNVVQADGDTPIKCVPPMPTPHAAPSKPPMSNHQIPQNLP
jgi:hypothetical protein